MADRDELALQSLLDAFPAVPLELMASAYTQARGDPNIAAELIANFPKALSVSQDCPASQSQRKSRFPKRSDAKKRSQDFSSRCAQGRLAAAGPGQPKLLDYFPPTQENAWVEPLQERLETNATMLHQLSLHDCHKTDAFESEFPCLGLHDVPLEKRQISVRSGMSTFARSSKRVSAASGLIPNVRIRPCDNVLSEPSSTLEVARTKDNVVNRWIESRGRNPGTGRTGIDASEEFLISMGDGLELGPEAARDVLGHDEGDVEKSYEDEMRKGASNFLEKKHARELGRKSNIHQDLEEEMLKQEHSSMKWVVERLCKEFPSADVGTLKEVLHVTNFNYSDAEKMLLEAGAKDDIGKIDHVELSNAILESFFKSKEGNGEKKVTQAECSSRNKPQKDPLNSQEPVWTVETASESSTAKFEEATMQVRSYGDWDDYERHHKSAKQQWLTMEQYFKVASAAYASGDVSRAELLSEKGKQFKKLAMEARERANNYLLEVKNHDNENDFILDLQEQHVTEALRLLKLHLQFLSPIPSCHSFTVIISTGNDVRPARSKVRQEVIRYLEKKEIEWSERSAFCLQVKLKKVQL